MPASSILRELADRHFPDAGLDAFNRTLFAFAAHNAGPTRIASLRHSRRRTHRRTKAQPSRRQLSSKHRPRGRRIG
jgi:membrane-bound lytic murein transglycosylase MltF